MNRPSLSRHHDPFWDLDGAAARRSRWQRQFARIGLVAFALLFVATVVSRLPAFDPQLITTSGNLRPVLAIAVFAILACCILIAAARIRAGSQQS